MTRMEQTFADLAKNGRKALIPFITAGDPDLATTEQLIVRIAESGADVIELGIPFSDPMADGPTIQLASERALHSGTTLQKILASVKSVRKETAIPVLLMGYYNPILQYGLEQFAQDAADAGVDAILPVDLPPEEAEELASVLRTKGIHLIFLLAPTSTEDRIKKVVRLAGGFIYYVSVTGVTGARREVSGLVSDAVAAIKKHTALPVAVGFGISSGEQAAEVARFADGVVVGSALVSLFEKFQGAELVNEAGNFVRSLKTAMDAE